MSLLVVKCVRLIIIAVTTGLQRHVDAEMAAAIEKLRKDGCK